MGWRASRASRADMANACGNQNRSKQHTPRSQLQSCFTIKNHACRFPLWLVRDVTVTLCVTRLMLDAY
eukprot:2155932-Prymnesium_polylepis.2